MSNEGLVPKVDFTRKGGQGQFPLTPLEEQRFKDYAEHGHEQQISQEPVTDLELIGEGDLRFTPPPQFDFPDDTPSTIVFPSFEKIEEDPDSFSPDIVERHIEQKRNLALGGPLPDDRQRKRVARRDAMITFLSENPDVADVYAKARHIGDKEAVYKIDEAIIKRLFHDGVIENQFELMPEKVVGVSAVDPKKPWEAGNVVKEVERAVHAKLFNPHDERFFDAVEAEVLDISELTESQFEYYSGLMRLRYQREESLRTHPLRKKVTERYRQMLAARGVNISAEKWADFIVNLPPFYGELKESLQPDDPTVLMGLEFDRGSTKNAEIKRLMMLINIQRNLLNLSSLLLNKAPELMN